MKIDDDQATDTLTMVLEEAPVVESDEDKPGVILDASTRVHEAARVDFRVAG